MKTFKDLTELEDPEKLRYAGLKIANRAEANFEKEMYKLTKYVNKTLSLIDKASGSFQSPGVRQEYITNIKEVVRKQTDSWNWQY